MTALFPGTFDPLTHGHTDLIQRACHLFDKVIVAITDNSNKTSLFTVEERLALAKQVLKDIPQVHVMSFSGLLVNFAKQQKAQVIIRGVRSSADFEYELQMTQVNRHLAPEIETVYLTPSPSLSFIASSLVREVVRLGGDVSTYVDPIVLRALHNKYAR